MLIEKYPYFARNTTTAVIIFSMILISGTIRLIQEIRAKNASKQVTVFQRI